LRRAVFSDLRLVTGTWSSLLHALKECENLEHLRFSSHSGAEHPVRRLDVARAHRTMTDMVDEFIAVFDTTAGAPNSQESDFVDPHHHAGPPLARVITTVPSE